MSGAVIKLLIASTIKVESSAKTLPVTSPVRVPVTLPVKLPVTLPVRVPVIAPVPAFTITTLSSPIISACMLSAVILPVTVNSLKKPPA